MVSFAISPCVPFNLPDNEHVPDDTLSDFSYEEVHVWGAHPDAAYGYWNAFVAPSNGEEAALGGKPEGSGIGVEV